MNGFDSRARAVAGRGLHTLVLVASIGLLEMPGTFAQATDTSNGRVSASIHDRYPAGSIHSLEAADAALADVARARSEIDARFAADEQACHPKFFTTSCIDKAKERRRQESAPLRKIELEAEQYKRQERLIERETAAVQRRDDEEAARLERVRPTRENDGAEQPERTKQESTRDAPPVSSYRTAEHAAKLKRIEEKDAANAERRAQNAMKYEEKARAAQERQKKVAQKKAEKEATRQAGPDVIRPAP